MANLSENMQCPTCIQNANEDSTSETEVDANIRLSRNKESFPLNQRSRSMALEDVMNNTKQLKSDFIHSMESHLSAMIDDVMDNLQKTEYPERFLMMSDSDHMMKDKRKASVAGRLPDKEFKSRPSILTEMLQVPHIKTIHNLFSAGLILVMVQTILTDIIETNSVDLGFERLMWTFAKPLTTLRILICMELFALFLFYPVFYFWSNYRHHYKAETRRMIDYGAMAGFAIFMMTFIYFPARALLRDPLGPATGALVTMEQCRLLMKMYAFVRSNVPRALMFDDKSEAETKSKRRVGEDENENEEKARAEVRKRVNGPQNCGLEVEKEDTRKNGEPRRVLWKQESWISWDDSTEKSPCPSYSRYLYFYFAPTLIYKDKYPRSSSIRWNYVVWNFGQVIGCIFYANFVVGKSCSIYFSKFGLPDHPMSMSLLCNAIFSLMLPGVFGLILGFFLLLHAWHNAFAEMLRFGDRLFYKDWWNRSSFSDYYKTWNVLVHDWLYTYVFKDAWESGLGQRHKALPTTLVFLVSSVFHEYILALSLNFMMPVLLILFGGFGFALVFVSVPHRSSVGNIALWTGLITGTGIILSCYSMEYYARINCPQASENGAWDFFIPRSLSCIRFK